MADESGAVWPHERAEPTVTEEERAAQEADATITSYAPTIERVRTPRRPPLIEIPDDLEVDVSAYVGKDRRGAPDVGMISVPVMDTDPAADNPLTETSEPEEADVDEPDDYHRAPWVRTQPLERSEVAPAYEEPPPAAPPEDPIERHALEASQQRIVALRLVAPDGNWSGQQLREALEAEGLRFGRYSIFHREREDGKTLFYVASMMEPGSFDLANMDAQAFPGVSLFGVVPGPLEAPAMFDMMLSVGRHLAECMTGQLQDEQGSTLTAQRILNLREELVHFEHRHKRLRRG
ncbi:MAG TPA: cell division protein ZipA C-terminal FtsZ-binding domain-containing protein [Steroidobacteraceae bacterium]|nr:cell division protein ZipA C-terminal FtsZ-binding domain-containing protein [Steroidobacteraceae bacterium]